MKHVSALLLTPLFLLSACGNSANQQSMTLDDALKNPLFAQHYYEDLTEQMVSLQLKNDPILKDSGKKSTVENTRARGTKLAQDAVDVTNANLHGEIVSDGDMSIGRVAFIESNLYFSTDFITTPGPSLHVYLTNVLDPRTIRFPDSTALDMGLIKNPYGAQTFTLPENTSPAEYRTMVLWDNALGKLYGFAQMQKN